MSKRDKLEPLADGFVAFHTESGERWKHKDVAVHADGQPAAYYRLFISDKGDERRYEFAPKDTRDATIWDLRHQLGKAQPASATAGAR
jgi:hypothetical protein